MQARRSLTCFLCERKTGAPVQCDNRLCYSAMHVHCGLQAGLTITEVEDEVTGETKPKVRCGRHSEQSGLRLDRFAPGGDCRRRIATGNYFGSLAAERPAATGAGDGAPAAAGVAKRGPGRPPNSAKRGGASVASGSKGGDCGRVDADDGDWEAGAEGAEEAGAVHSFFSRFGGGKRKAPETGGGKAGGGGKRAKDNDGKARRAAVGGDSTESENDEATEVEGDGEVYCVCRGPDDGTFMIECERCETWFHGRCVGVTTEAEIASVTECEMPWVCPTCSRSAAGRKR